MSQQKGFFIAGTDTEIGKTLVSGAIILKLRQQGTHALGFKPVVAGTYINSDGIEQNEDLETLRIASHSTTNKINICPYVLNTPAAPHIIAEKKGIRLDIKTMLIALDDLKKQSNFVVVEGAGGFMTPVNKVESLADFAQRIDFPTILVVGMKLGCINHALLTLEAIQSRKVPLAGWIANSLANEMSFLSENVETLKSQISAPFLGCIPPLPKECQKGMNQPYPVEALYFAAQHIQLPSI